MRVTCDVSVSVDGFVAGPNQSLELPLGERAGDRLHKWMFDEPEANSAALDAIPPPAPTSWGGTCSGPAAEPGVCSGRAGGASSRPITPRCSCSPATARSACDGRWHDVTFVTDGIESALQQAREATGEADIAIAGGADTMNQYLATGAIDELRLHVAPVVLGDGARLFDGVGELELEPTDVGGSVTHVSYRVLG